VLDGTHNQTHGEGILSTLPEGFAFDAIITDPPYNMAEVVQHSKSKQAPSRGERSSWTPHIATDEECVEMDVSSGSATMSTYSSSATSSSSPSSSSTSSSSSPSSSSLSAAVDTNIMTLLRLASETLRVGGKLVFFAPHRESDGAKGRGREDQLNRGDSIRKCVPAAAHAEQQGDGLRGSISDFIAVESTPDQQKLIDERVQTKVEALTYDTQGVIDDSYLPGASQGLSLSDQEGVKEQKEESVLPGMGLKMSKRKAFRKRARIAKDEEEESPLLPGATHINKSTSRSMSRTAPTSPLGFLPSLPDSLTLVGYHEQVMSPSFSRWLCVIQKL
jgi:hypothetical protein